MDLEKIKNVVFKIVDSIAKSLGVELRVLVLIAFLVGYILGRLWLTNMTLKRNQINPFIQFCWIILEITPCFKSRLVS